MGSPSPSVPSAMKLSSSAVKLKLDEMNEIKESLQVTEYCVKVTSRSAKLAIEHCNRAFAALDQFITSYKEDIRPQQRRWK